MTEGRTADFGFDVEGEDIRIEKRAYEIWEQEGRPDGRALEHWLQAKAELKERAAYQELKDAAAYEELEDEAAYAEPPLSEGKSRR